MKKVSRRRRIATAVAVSAGITMAMGSTAQAADITVTDTGDSGSGSLRGAITTANQTPATSDRILFQPGLTGTILLFSDLPELEGPTEIAGPGMEKLKIDGGAEHQIFFSERDTKISGITISRGAATMGGGVGIQNAGLTVDKVRIDKSMAASGGGGIAVLGGQLTVIESLITGNEAPTGGGIATHDVVLTMSGTTISGNEATGGSPSQGGAADFGLDAESSSTIRDSVISGNSADTVAGLAAGGGDLAIESTLISDNTSPSFGGGLVLGFSAGATPGTDDSVSLTNSTVTGNQAQALAGVVSFAKHVTIDSSTITGNTVDSGSAPPPELPPGYWAAGLAQANGPLVLRNSIVSGNVPDDVGTLPAATPQLENGRIEAAFSLIGGRTAGTSLTETVPGSNIASTDPQLGALGENGGPIPTMSPSDTSPVVNKGSSALATDARGLTRPVDFAGIPFSAAAGANGADIGAVELQYTPPPPPPPPDPPSNAFSFGWAKLNKKKGVATLQVNVPGAGTVRVAGSKTVKKFTKPAKRAGIVTVTIKAKGKAAKQLKKKGKAKVTAKVSFAPNGGTARTKSKTLKLVKKKPKKKS